MSWVEKETSVEMETYIEKTRDSGVFERGVSAALETVEIPTDSPTDLGNFLSLSLAIAERYSIKTQAEALGYCRNYLKGKYNIDVTYKIADEGIYITWNTGRPIEPLALETTKKTLAQHENLQEYMKVDETSTTPSIITEVYLKLYEGHPTRIKAIETKADGSITWLMHLGYADPIYTLIIDVLCETMLGKQPPANIQEIGERYERWQQHMHEKRKSMGLVD